MVVKNNNNSVGVVNISAMRELEQKKGANFKLTIPLYLYKPPFGYPRNINVPFVREVARSFYVQMVTNTLQRELCGMDWDIVLKNDFKNYKMTSEDEKVRASIKEFFKNPNDGEDSFDDLIRKWLQDIINLDSGCFNKIYNKKKGKDRKLVQIMNIDGGLIVKNPDIHGRLGDREDYIDDYKNSPLYYQPIQGNITTYRKFFGDRAAYFQYSFMSNSVPIPFGKKEIIYSMMNPATDTVYTFTSPVQMCIDVIMNLVYGVKYNLDIYMNSNIPEGIIQMAGISEAQRKKLQDELRQSMYTTPDDFGLRRRLGGKAIVTNSSETKFTPLKFTSKEMEIVQQQEWFVRLLWACFGITASELGFTDNSNKSTEGGQDKVIIRKALRPYAKKLADTFSQLVIPELDEKGIFEFKFINIDLEEENKKMDLYKKQIDMGLKTWQMVAEDEGIDINKVNQYKEENKEEDEEEERYNNEKVEQKSADLKLALNLVKEKIEQQSEKIIDDVIK